MRTVMKKILMLTAFALTGLAAAQDTTTTTTETTTTTTTVAEPVNEIGRAHV